jgi:hypothetical protein
MTKGMRSMEIGITLLSEEERICANTGNINALSESKAKYRVVLNNTKIPCATFSEAWDRLRKYVQAWDERMRESAYRNIYIQKMIKGEWHRI